MSDDVQVIVVDDANDPTPIYVPGELGAPTLITAWVLPDVEVSAT